MISIDAKNEIFCVRGSTIDVITDIGYAIFEVASTMSQTSDLNWDDTLARLMGSLTRAVKTAHEEVQNDSHS